MSTSKAEKKIKSNSLPFHGEGTCSRQGCQRRAYYSVGSKAICGSHSRGVKRIALPKRPASERKAITDAELAAHQQTCDAAAAANLEGKKTPALTCFKMAMMKSTPRVPGVINVFPNDKAHAGQGGLAMPALSPKRMGPIAHGQPGVPPALSIENLHQGNKVFDCFKDHLDAWRAIRDAMYQSEKAYRHQNDFWKDHPELIPSGITLPTEKKNAPDHSRWIMPDGSPRKFSYVESRQFYCHFYEKFAKQTPEFKELQRLIAHGYNLRICGYDAYTPTDSIEMHYLDPARPFGHELVLYTLLVRPNGPYPWITMRSKDVVFPN